MTASQLQEYYTNAPPAANISVRGYFTSCPDPRTFGHPTFEPARPRSPQERSPQQWAGAALNERHRRRLGLLDDDPDADRTA